MAGSTTNLGLTKPLYSEDADIDVINDNMDTIDTAINAMQGAISIVANGNTHAEINAGQYVYVRNHSTLAEGIYTATSNITANATLSNSNLTSAGGVLNNITVVLLNDDTASTAYSKLSKLTSLATYTIYINGTAMSNLTNGRFSAGATGTVAKISNSNYRYHIMFGSTYSLQINQTGVSNSSWGTSAISTGAKLIQLTASDTLSTSYEKLNLLDTGETATIYINGTLMSNMTNGKYSSAGVGTVTKISITNYRFNLMLGQTEHITINQSSMSSSSWGMSNITNLGTFHVGDTYKTAGAYFPTRSLVDLSGLHFSIRLPKTIGSDVSNFTVTITSDSNIWYSNGTPVRFTTSSTIANKAMYTESISFSATPTGTIGAGFGICSLNATITFI